MLINILDKKDKDCTKELESFFLDIHKGTNCKLRKLSKENSYSKTISLYVDSIESFAEAVRNCDIQIG
jgi:hypothetical protein